MIRSRWTLALVSGALFLVAAVFAVGGSTSDLRVFPQPEPRGVPEKDWRNPLPSQISDPSEASLPFEPHIPGPALGQPAGIFTSESGGLSALREIAWVYENQRFGLFNVTERIVDRASAESLLLELASTQPGCVAVALDPVLREQLGVPLDSVEWNCSLGERATVLIEGSNGEVAILVAEGPDVTAITWLEPLSRVDEAAVAQIEGIHTPALEVLVSGPKAELTRQEAIQIATSF